MKTCKICTQEKPFHATQKPYSKASGFHGNVCWDCYVQTARMRAQGTDPKDPVARQLEQATYLAWVKELHIKGIIQKVNETMRIAAKLQGTFGLATPPNYEVVLEQAVRKELAEGFLSSQMPMR